MCTVRDIEEAIREHCQSQHDMESTEIDQVMQRLPFGTAQDVFTRPLCRSRRIPGAAGTTAPDRRSLFEDCGFFHAMNTGRSDANGRFSH